MAKKYKINRTELQKWKEHMAKRARKRNLNTILKEMNEGKMHIQVPLPIVVDWMIEVLIEQSVDETLKTLSRIINDPVKEQMKVLSKVKKKELLHKVTSLFFYSTSEVAKLLGVSEKTIYRRARTGQLMTLPRTSRKGKYFFEKKYIDEMIKFCPNKRM